MKRDLILGGLLCFLLVGCNGSGLPNVKVDVDVEAVNRSTRDLQNTEARFGDHVCGWGFIGRGFTKVYLFYPRPITLDVELHWDEGATHRTEKVDLRKIYPVGRSGRLTFSVYDGRVEVNFSERADRK